MTSPRDGPADKLRLMKRLIVALLILGPLSACAAGSDAPSDDGSVSSIDDLKATVTKAGYECAAWGEAEAQTMNGSIQTMKCSNGDGLVYFRDSSGAGLYENEMREKIAEFDDDYVGLIGPNWALVSDQASNFRDELGGTLVDRDDRR